MDRLLTALHVCFALGVVSMLAGFTGLALVFVGGFVACLAAITVGGVYEVARDVTEFVRRRSSSE